jgi:hypothetical protein
MPESSSALTELRPSSTRVLFSKEPLESFEKRIYTLSFKWIVSVEATHLKDLDALSLIAFQYMFSDTLIALSACLNLWP